MEVRFKNFRCFKDTGLLNLKKITLLVGENSSGKTSFLAGLNHISALMNQKDSDLNSPPFELGTFQDIYHNYKKGGKTQYLEYEFNLDTLNYRWVFKDNQGELTVSSFKATNMDKEHNISLEFKPDEKATFLETQLSDEERKILESVFRKILVFGKVVKIQDIKNSSLKRLKFSDKDIIRWSGRHDLISKIGDIAWIFEREFLDRQMRWEIQPMLPDLENKDNEIRNLFERLATGLRQLAECQGSSRMHHHRSPEINFIALAPLRTEPARIYLFPQSRGNLNPDGSHVPDKLLRHSIAIGPEKNYLEKMLQKFGKEAGLFKVISIKRLDEDSNYPFSIRVKTAQGKISNIMDVGYGVSQILPVVFEIISSDSDAQFLVQQPEVHLHPKAQAAFGSLISELSKKGKRFIIETHSDFILDRLKYEIEEKNISHDDVGILFFDTEKEVTEIHQIDLGENGLPTTRPESYRRFFLNELGKVWP